MNPLVAAALFFIIWWLCFFIVLPIGVQSAEGGAGHDTGAPEKPDLARKAVWATIGAVAVWGIALFVLNYVYYSR